MKKKFGFTFAEIMTVTIILGVIAGVALPSYNAFMRRLMRQEAEQVLLAVFNGELDFRRNRGGFTKDIDKLDVTIPMTKQYNRASLTGNITSQNISCSAGNQFWLARITSADNTHHFYVLTDGQIVCQDVATASCAAAICRQMGYGSSW